MKNTNNKPANQTAAQKAEAKNTQLMQYLSLADVDEINFLIDYFYRHKTEMILLTGICAIIANDGIDRLKMHCDDILKDISNASKIKKLEDQVKDIKRSIIAHGISIDVNPFR